VLLTDYRNSNLFQYHDRPMRKRIIVKPPNRLCMTLETCEIRIVYQKKSGLSGAIGSRDWFFEATATGPNGQYSAGSEILVPRSIRINLKITGDYTFSSDSRNHIIIHNDARVKLDNLIKRLYADGWQSIGRGNEWYNLQFQRNI